MKTTTYGIVNETIDAAVTADTETLLMDETIPEGKGGRIKQIIIAYAGVTDAKASTGYCELKLGSHSGPFRFPIGSGAGGATSTPQQPALVINVDIEVNGSEKVKLYITLAEAAVDAHGGILWEA